MTILRIPSPLRPYASGVSQIEVKASDVAGALEELITAYPELETHLFTENGQLRGFVNLFLNDENVSQLQGTKTKLKPEDSLMILPSIAGGMPKVTELQKVDHAALRTNQTFIIALSLAAFVVDAPWLAGLVGLAMLFGTLRNFPAFGFTYKYVFKPRGWLKPDVLTDNPEPHRFAQGFGAVVLMLGTGFLLGGQIVVGWGLVWLVIFLAALNLFSGFCVGCAVYYWLNRLNVSGFDKSPPPGTFPGARPKVEPL